MQKSCFSVTIIITMLFSVIVLYPLLPMLARGKQEQQQQDLFPFSFPTTTGSTTTTTTKSQTNIDTQNESTMHHSFSAHNKKVENNTVNMNDNGSDDINDSNNDNVAVNNPFTERSSTSSSSNNNIPKAVILNFYDNDIGQFINAKPILDKYGFKGSFFIVCSWASSDNPDRMNWQQITQLYNEGHDINSHSTSHKVLTELSADDLDYEVGQSKECFRKHIGAEPTVFSPPHSKGWNNATIIDM